MSIRISHVGNTANNAYYHHLIFDSHGLVSELPIQDFNLRHAMSHPGWESLSFIPSSYKWVEYPDWTDVPFGLETGKFFLAVPFFFRIEQALRDILRPVLRLTISKPLVFALRTSVFLMRALMEWAQDAFVRFKPKHWSRFGNLPLGPPGLAQRRLQIIYGLNFLSASLKPKGAKRRTLMFEHGTLRWAGINPPIGSLEKTWLDFVRGASSLMVTNLDPPSLAVARQHFPGRWLAYPHPYVFFNGPLPPSTLPTRAQLIRELDAEFLIFLPSSQNWKLSYHNKGSDIAWEAFFSLRKEGKRVGLIASEWGGDIQAAKAAVEASGFAANVRWQVPVPRIPMLRLLGEVDMCWDQFSIQGFGATALKAVEAGTPLISQGLTDDAVDLTGFQVPWRVAGCPQSLADETDRTMMEISQHGLPRLKESTLEKYHQWFWNYHSPQVVMSLTNLLIERAQSGAKSQLNPDSWKRVIDRNNAGR